MPEREGERRRQRKRERGRGAVSQTLSWMSGRRSGSLIYYLGTRMPHSCFFRSELSGEAAHLIYGVFLWLWLGCRLGVLQPWPSLPAPALAWLPGVR